jgi:hypothetical protein
VGDGGEGEGEKREGEEGGQERSVMKPVSPAEQVKIKNINQPMMVMTVSGGVKRWQAIEQHVRQVRHEG